jgi:hypothetical protein
MTHPSMATSPVLNYSERVEALHDCKTEWLLCMNRWVTDSFTFYRPCESRGSLGTQL